VLPGCTINHGVLLRMPKVQAYVYDISNGMAAQMSPMLLGKKIDLIPHTGIVVFGKEYFFGSGPCVGEPGKTVPVSVSQVLDLGETGKVSEELEAFIDSSLACEYTPENYNLLSHNCNHYADAISKFLLDGVGLPASIVNVADEALSTPQGQSLRVMIESMEKDMRSNMGGASAMNPFGTASGAAAAPVQAATSALSSTVDTSELVGALKELASSNSVEAQRTALQTLSKVTENVVKNNKDPKFRSIKVSNAAFHKKVSSCPGGVETMLACGWLPGSNDEGEDVWSLDDDAASRQSGFLECIAAALTKLPPAPVATPSPPTPASNHQTSGAGWPSPGMPGGLPGTAGGLPGGMNPQMMQQMMQNPQMMQQAQQMLGQNPQMMAQAQQMMQNPAMMAQIQQMMQDPQAMAQMQSMMGGMGRGGGRGGGFPPM